MCELGDKYSPIEHELRLVRQKAKASLSEAEETFLGNPIM
jgi:hypothetical protein